MWDNLPFSQRKKATERAARVEVGGDRKEGGRVGQNLKNGGRVGNVMGVFIKQECWTPLPTMLYWCFFRGESFIKKLFLQLQIPSCTSSDLKKDQNCSNINLQVDFFLFTENCVRLISFDHYFNCLSSIPKSQFEYCDF